MWNDILEEAGRLRQEEQPFVLATVVAYKNPPSAKPGSKAIIESDGTVTGWVGGGCVQPIVLREAKKAMQTGKPKLLSICPDASHDDWEGIESYRMTCEGGGSLEIYLEPVLPKPEMVIVGRSPVAEILAGLGHLLDFKLCIVDPGATSERFPEADLILTDFGLAKNRISERTFVVVATMGNGDEEGLHAVVGSRARYLGLVASRKKAGTLIQYLIDKGVTNEQLAQIRCPAGLKLGGDTMPEIALGVMAEIAQLRRASMPKVELEDTEPGLRKIKNSEPEQASGPATAFDPICGMTVDTHNARYRSVFDNETFYFCSTGCKERFDGSPQG